MLQYFLAFSEYPTFTDLIRKHTIECIYQTKILETRAMTVASGLHAKKTEKIHRKEKLKHALLSLM